jgi:hypothetical protein
MVPRLRGKVSTVYSARGKTFPLKCASRLRDERYVPAMNTAKPFPVAVTQNKAIYLISLENSTR